MWLVLSAAPVFGEGSVSFNSGNGARTFMAGFGRIMADFESFKDSAVFSNPNAGLYSDSEYRYIYVYAKYGETINIGTSYTEADIDFTVIRPDGVSTDYDVTVDSPGYIGNYIQERNGPKTVCRTSDCSGYYNPIKIIAMQEGLYKIAFYSSAFGSINAEEAYKNVTDDFISWFGCIAAYDVTVTDSSNTAHPGRVFTYTIYSATCNFIPVPTDAAHAKNLFYRRNSRIPRLTNRIRRG